MSLKNHIRWLIEQSDWITMAYVQDLADADFLLRPVPGMNHVAWQMGHMITGSKKMLSGLGLPPALPAGFEDHTKGGLSDDPAKFASKDVSWNWRRRPRRPPWRPSTPSRRANWTIRAPSRCGSSLPPWRPC